MRYFGKGKRYVFDKEFGKWIPEEERKEERKSELNFPQIDAFKPRVYYNLDKRPITIESRGQLRRELKSRGLVELG